MKIIRLFYILLTISYAQAVQTSLPHQRRNYPIYQMRYFESLQRKISQNSYLILSKLSKGKYGTLLTFHPSEKALQLFYSDLINPWNDFLLAEKLPEDPISQNIQKLREKQFTTYFAYILRLPYQTPGINLLEPILEQLGYSNTISPLEEEWQVPDIYEFMGLKDELNQKIDPELRLMLGFYPTKSRLKGKDYIENFARYGALPAVTFNFNPALALHDLNVHVSTSICVIPEIFYMYQKLTQDAVKLIRFLEQEVSSPKMNQLTKSYLSQVITNIYNRLSKLIDHNLGHLSSYTNGQEFSELSQESRIALPFAQIVFTDHHTKSEENSVLLAEVLQEFRSVISNPLPIDLDKVYLPPGINSYMDFIPKVTNHLNKLCVAVQLITQQK